MDISTSEILKEVIQIKETGVRLLDRALYILEVVSEQSEPIGVNQISQLTKIHQSSAFRILQTLCKSGWVNQEENGKYQIGPKAYLVGKRYDNFRDLKEISYYTMQWLSDLSGEAVNLIVLRNNKCFILQQTRSNRLVDLVAPIGTELPLHTTAGAKIILSELPDEILQHLIEFIDFMPLTEFSLTDKEKFLEELKTVTQNGYAMDNQETIRGGRCISVPVRDHQGKIIAALSLSGILRELTADDIKKFSDDLDKAAKEIALRLFNYQNRTKLMEADDK